MNGLDKAMTNAWVRGAIAATLGTYTTIIAVKAKKNIDILKERIKALEKLKSDFAANTNGSGLVACNMDEAQEGESEKCKSIRANAVKDLNKSKWGMLGYSNQSPVKVCVTKNNKIDEDCRCKETKTCARVPSSFNIGALGNSSWANALSSPTNSLLTGNISGADLDTADLNNKTYALKNKLKQLEKDPKFAKQAKKVNGLSNKLMKLHNKSFKKSFPKGLPSSLASLSAPISNSVATSPKDVVKKVQERIAASKKSKFEQGDEPTGAAKAASNGLDFDWGDSASGGTGGVKIDDVASVMDKNFKIKGDINKNSNQDIFKILSIRYQRSGLRRLFDESGKSSYDEANDTDINEK